MPSSGITDGGFNLKSVQAPSTDFYLGKELKASLKGLSKLPSLKELKEIRTGRPTENAELVLDKDKFRPACFDTRGGVDIVVDLFLAIELGGDANA